MKHFINCLFLLPLLISSCVEEKTIHNVDLTGYLQSECYSVSKDKYIVTLNIQDCEIIRTERIRDAITFTYEQYASMAALLFSRGDIQGIDSIYVEVSDDDNKSHYRYSVENLKSVNNKVLTDFEFGRAMIENDRTKATACFNHVINSLTQDEIDAAFFNKYFIYGKVTDFRIAFFVINRGLVNVFAEVEFDDKLAQTFVFVHELNGSDKIANIEVPMHGELKSPEELGL